MCVHPGWLLLPQFPKLFVPEQRKRFTVPDPPFIEPLSLELVVGWCVSQVPYDAFSMVLSLEGNR